MPKPSHGTTKSAASKKKLRKHPELQPIPRPSTSEEATLPVQTRTPVVERSGSSTVQFRPKAREAARAAAGRSPARALQIVDYGYVYADLKLIGALCLLLFGVLVVLSFMLR